MCWWLCLEDKDGCFGEECCLRDGSFGELDNEL